jgi:MscS family membrane protein
MLIANEFLLDVDMNFSTFLADARSLIAYDGEYSWMIEIFTILLATAFTGLAVSFLLAILDRQFQRTENWWDDVLLNASRKPIKLAVWVMGIFYAVEVISRESKADVFKSIDDVRDVALVMLIAWALNRFIGRGEEHYIAARTRRQLKVDITAVDAIGKLIKISINISAALIALQSLGVSVSGLLAFGGIGGVAVGFAAKDMLANFFGGLMIYFDKPFKVGDWIRSPDKEIEGTVERIGWRLTTIRTFDKRPLYVPNSVFANVSVENPSRMLNRRIKEHIGIRYDDIKHMEPITRDVKRMLIEHPEIDENQTTIVNFDGFQESSCVFLLYCFTYTTDWITYHRVKQDVLLKIMEIIRRHGAEIAYPTRTIMVTGEEGMLPTARLAEMG